MTMKLTVHYGNGAVALPAAFFDYLDKADSLTLKLFLTLAQEAELRESLDTKALAKRFAVKEEAIESAISFWENAELLSRSEQERDQSGPKAKSVTVSAKTGENGNTVTVVSSDPMPNYTGAELEALFEENPGWHSLIDECQKIAGKLFGRQDQCRVIAMTDVLRFDEESVLLLFHYAKSRDKCSCAYVLSIAKALLNEGITAFAEVEAYIASKEKAHGVENLIRRLAGIGARAFTAVEKRFITAWSDADYPEELLTLAYEVTVNALGKFTFQYMNKVLANWHEAGYKTRQDAEAAMAAFRKGKSDDGKESFDVEDFLNAAINRTKNTTLKNSDGKKST